jgi:hypothetical protein
MVFDGDARYRERNPHKSEVQAASAINKATKLNRKLLTYLGGTPEDFPQTAMGTGYAVFHETLETYLEQEWPEWTTAKKQLVMDGAGSDKKHEETYRQAALNADGHPPHLLASVVAHALLLAKQN